MDAEEEIWICRIPAIKPSTLIRSTNLAELKAEINRAVEKPLRWCGTVHETLTKAIGHTEELSQRTGEDWLPMQISSELARRLTSDTE